jgi:HNH endonuclease
MHIEWTDKRCILCTLAPFERQSRCAGTAKLTKEHLIPEAIGGRLTCDFLCKFCNDNLGQIEADLKEDSRIRLAIENLKDSLPELWRSMSEGQSYLAQAPDGTVAAKLKNGELRVNSSKRVDGSIVRPLDDSAKAVRTMLQRRGATQDEITNAEMRFRELPEGVRVTIADGIEVMKSTPNAVYPALNSQSIEPRALLKIAYEYLALHLRGNIFHQYFNPIRTFLAGGVIPNCCSVFKRRVREKKYRPYHGLAIKNTIEALVVKIRLFGYLSYPVHFHGLQIPSGRSYCYTLHLDTKQEYWT